MLGLDRHAPPHEFGSSQGHVRVIREAYFEHPSYVPLVQRAYLLWEELERETHRRLLMRTGCALFGNRDGWIIKGTHESAVQHGLACHEESIAEITRRLPMVRPDAAMTALWEPHSGFLMAEDSVSALIEVAKRHGAELHANEPVRAWRALGDGVEVTTAHGRYTADHLILSNGAWMRDLLPELPLTVERAVQLWFEPVANHGMFVPQLFPITLWEYAKEKYFYTFPMLDGAIKAAIHYGGEKVEHPDQLRREVTPEDEEALREALGRYIPDANGRLRHAQVCMYANTPDLHFVLDRHPEHRQVLIASVCSGHGFKFAPTIGEILSDMVVEGFTRHDISLFKLGRFAGQSRA